MTDISYKIVKANAELGQVEVEYIYNEQSLGRYAIDVPIEHGSFVSADKLAEEINKRSPTWLVKRKQAVAEATGFSEIEKLVEITPPVVSTQSDIDNIINEILNSGN